MFLRNLKPVDYPAQGEKTIQFTEPSVYKISWFHSHFAFMFFCDVTTYFDFIADEYETAQVKLSSAVVHRQTV